MTARRLIAGLALAVAGCNGSQEPGGSQGVEELEMPGEPLSQPGARLTGSVPAGMENAVAAAREDLAQRLQIDGQAITVLQARPVTWSAGHLGCPAPGMMYTQALTPGVLVVLEAEGRRYAYHGGTRGQPMYCPESRALPPAADREVDR